MTCTCQQIAPSRLQIVAPAPKEVGSTFLQVIDRYAEELKKTRNKLVLAGVSTQVYRQLESTGLLEKLGRENVYSATDIITESLQRAINDAN